MRILALDRIVPNASLEKMKPLFRQEAQCAYELYKSGRIRELFFRTDRPGAAMLLECESTADARSLLDALPLVRAGLVEFELIPLGPFPFEAAFA
jgi:hypothetical protein